MFYQKLWPTLAALGLIFLVAPALWAQSGEGLDAASTRLDAVVVTSSRTEETLREVSSVVNVIDQEALQKFPEERLDQILRREGYYINEYPGQDSAQIMIRGFKNSSFMTDGGLGGSIMLLVDGRPSGVSNIARLTKVNVERIEIIHGPAALQYGASALGGAINIITRRGEGDFSAHVKTGLGSYSFNDQLLGFDGRVGLLDYAFDFYRSGVEDFDDAKGRRMYGTDTNALYSGSLNLGLNFLDDRHRLGLVASVFDNKKQGIGGYVAPGFSSYENDYGDTLDLNNKNFDLSYAGRTESDFLSWAGRYYHTEEYRKYYYGPTRDRNDPNVSTYGPYKTSVDGFQGQATANWNIVELTGGFDAIVYHTDDKGYNYADTPDVKHRDLAGFLIAKIRLLDDRLIFNGGLRYDSFKIDLDGKPSSNLTNLTPSIGVAFLPLEWLKLRANYAEGFHLPTPNQLTRDAIGDSPPVHYLSNPDLDPFTSKSYEIGFDVFQPTWNIYVTYFNSKYRGQVRSALTGEIDGNGLPIERYFNASEPTTYAGVEFGGSVDVGAQAGWDFGLSPYLKATVFTERKAYREATRAYETDVDIPKLIVSYGLDFAYPEFDLTASLNATYVGEARAQNWSMVNPRPAPYMGYFNTDSYTLVDLSLSKALMKSADETRKLTLDVAVRNLFDKYYESIVDYPGPGRNFYVGLRYDFN